MRNIAITSPAGYAALIALFLCVIAALLFTTINLQAVLIHREIIFSETPPLRTEQARYYKNNLSRIARASSLSPSNADYYAVRADILSNAIKMGLQSQLGIYDADIEKYYKKAIELNPVDFSYRYNLSLSYMQQNNPAAENTFFTTIELCPNCYVLHADLANYYLQNDQPNQAFFSMLTMLWRGGIINSRILNVMADKYGRRLNSITFRAERGEVVRLSVYPKAPSVDFNEAGLPPVRIPLRLQIYTKGIVDEAVLYHKFTPYAFFTKNQKGDSGYIMYEARIEKFPPGANLSEFRVEIDGGNAIEELVFIIDFSVYSAKLQK